MDWSKYPNFREDEFRCRCKMCQRNNLPVDVDERLVAGLQELRDLVLSPVIISSGVRCRAHNRAVGGALDSKHIHGKAADITVRGLTPDEVADVADDVQAFRDGGIGLYPRTKDRKGWVHVDVRVGKARWRG